MTSRAGSAARAEPAGSAHVPDKDVRTITVGRARVGLLGLGAIFDVHRGTPPACPPQAEE